MSLSRKGVLIQLFLLLMFSVAGSVLAQESIFSDSFDDPSLPGWDYSPDVKVEGGALIIPPGGYAKVSGNWQSQETSIRVLMEGPTLLAIRYMSSGEDEFRLELSPTEVVLFQNDEQIFHNEIKLPPFEEWFNLAISVQGETHDVYINDQQILHVDQAALLSGGGIRFEGLGEAYIWFDDLTIHPLGGEAIMDKAEAVEPPPEETNTTPPESEPLEAAPPAQAAAQGEVPAPPWKYTGGPIGGLGYDIRMDPRNPDVMYVTDAFQGVFKSVNGGKNWVPHNEGITARTGASGDVIPVFSLTIDPNNPDIIWAGTQYGGGVFRSDNAGLTWNRKNNGIEEFSITVRGLTVEPGNSDVVYLAGEIGSWEWNGEETVGLGFDLTKGVVYKTEDRGESWRRIWYGDNLARYVLLDPQDHQRLYVSTGIFDREAANSNLATLDPGGLGVLRSLDGGKSWEALGTNRGFDPIELYISSLAMHPTNSNILFAAGASDAHQTARGEPNGGVYRTVDGGDNWERLIGITNVSGIEICESDPEIIYAGSSSNIARSDDGGDTWVEYGTNEAKRENWWGSEGTVGGFPIDMQCDPRDQNRLFINNYGGGNFLTIDGGKTWTTASKGYTGAIMFDVAAAPNDPGLIYASARSGVFKSTDGGENWNGMAHGLARGLIGNSIAVDPYNYNHIVAIILETSPPPKISKDGGLTWTEASASVEGVELYEWFLVRKLEFSPYTEDAVIAIQGEQLCEQLEACQSGSGAIYSKDGGNSWNVSSLSSVMLTDFAFAPNGWVYGLVFPDDLYRSKDNGVTWELVKEKINPVQSSSQDPNFHRPNATAIAVDPADPNILYTGFNRNGIAISKDSGQTWDSSYAGLEPEITILDFAVDQSHDGVVYAGTREQGVYRSENYGQSWSSINEGLTMRNVQSLAISADGSVVYVASDGGGVYRLGPAMTATTEPKAVEEVIVDPDLPAAEVEENGGSRLILWIVLGLALAGCLVCLGIVIRRRRG